MGLSPRVRMRDIARIYDAANLGILITTGSGTLIWGNKYYSDMAGFDVSKYYGTDVRDISKNENVKLSTGKKMIDYIYETKKPYTETVRYQTNDYIITTAAPIMAENNPDKIEYIIYTMSNFTELNKLQESLSQSNAQLLALRTQLQSIQVEQTLNDKIAVVDRQMINIYGKAQRLANTSVSVMLTGESGCGKDVLAKYIHSNSNRAKENFIHVNMATIPKSLFESELFGYTAGSFSGASKEGKAGLLQLADKGTVFLDEIGELPLDIQAKLLQVIQNKEVRPIGAIESFPVDFRIICATNRNLKEMVNKGEFRLDLYYRLNSVELNIPPLRERRSDIPVLANLFIKQFNEQEHTKRTLSPAVLHAFQNYYWPGNIRELQHVIESLVALSPTNLITPDQLPEEFNIVHTHSTDGEKGIDLKSAVSGYERNLIRAALERCSTAAEAAKELGLDATTLCKKRKRYGL